MSTETRDALIEILRRAEQTPLPPDGPTIQDVLIDLLIVYINDREARVRAEEFVALKVADADV